MRNLAIGDIHGCLRSLESLALYVGFREDDAIVTLGDYVDRGPDSKGVIDFILQLREKHNVVTLKGNHEVMMLESTQSESSMKRWLTYGGKETLASYGTTFTDISTEHWEFMKEARPYHEIDTHFFVHANVDHNAPIYAQPDEMLYWERFGKPRPHVSGKTMVCGHTIQGGGEIRNVGHAVCIDTGAYGGGWLTCLDVNSGYFWQTNEEGQRRSGAL